MGVNRDKEYRKHKRGLGKLIAEGIRLYPNATQQTELADWIHAQWKARFPKSGTPMLVFAADGNLHYNVAPKYPSQEKRKRQTELDTLQTRAGQLFVTREEQVAWVREQWNKRHPEDKTEICRVSDGQLLVAISPRRNEADPPPASDDSDKIAPLNRFERRIVSSRGRQDGMDPDEVRRLSAKVLPSLRQGKLFYTPLRRGLLFAAPTEAQNISVESKAESATVETAAQLETVDTANALTPAEPVIDILAEPEAVTAKASVNLDTTTVTDTPVEAEADRASAMLQPANTIDLEAIDLDELEMLTRPDPATVTRLSSTSHQHRTPAPSEESQGVTTPLKATRGHARLELTHERDRIAAAAVKRHRKSEKEQCRWALNEWDRLYKVRPPAVKIRDFNDLRRSLTEPPLNRFAQNVAEVPAGTSVVSGPSQESEPPATTATVVDTAASAVEAVQTATTTAASTVLKSDERTRLRAQRIDRRRRESLGRAKHADRKRREKYDTELRTDRDRLLAQARDRFPNDLSAQLLWARRELIRAWTGRSHLLNAGVLDRVASELSALPLPVVDEQTALQSQPTTLANNQSIFVATDEGIEVVAFGGLRTFLAQRKSFLAHREYLKRKEMKAQRNATPPSAQPVQAAPIVTKVLPPTIQPASRIQPLREEKPASVKSPKATPIPAPLAGRVSPKDRKRREYGGTTSRRELAETRDWLIREAERQFPNQPGMQGSWAKAQWQRFYPECPPLISSAVFTQLGQDLDKLYEQPTTPLATVLPPWVWATPVPESVVATPTTTLPSATSDPAASAPVISDVSATAAPSTAASARADAPPPTPPREKRKSVGREARQQAEDALQQELDQLVQDAQARHPGQPAAQSDWAGAQWKISHPQKPDLVDRKFFEHLLPSLSRSRFRADEKKRKVTQPKEEIKADSYESAAVESALAGVASEPTVVESIQEVVLDQPKPAAQVENPAGKPVFVPLEDLIQYAPWHLATCKPMVLPPFDPDNPSHICIGAGQRVSVTEQQKYVFVGEPDSDASTNARIGTHCITIIPKGLPLGGFVRSGYGTTCIVQGEEFSPETILSIGDTATALFLPGTRFTGELRLAARWRQTGEQGGRWTTSPRQRAIAIFKQGTILPGQIQAAPGCLIYLAGELDREFEADPGVVVICAAGARCYAGPGSIVFACNDAVVRRHPLSVVLTESMAKVHNEDDDFNPFPIFMPCKGYANRWIKEVSASISGFECRSPDKHPRSFRKIENSEPSGYGRFDVDGLLIAGEPSMNEYGSSLLPLWKDGLLLVDPWSTSVHLQDTL